MNVIDQAFVKAYSRRTKPQAAGSATDRGAAAGAITGSPDVSVHPQAAESAVVWIDAVADQYLRRDTPHPATPMPSPLSDALAHQPLPPRARGASNLAAADPTHSGRDAHRQPAERDEPAPAADDLAQGISRLQAQAAARQSLDLSFLYHSVIASGAQPEGLLATVALPTIRRDPAAEPIAAPQAPTAPQPAEPAPAFASAPAFAPAPASAPAPAFAPFAALWEVDCFEFSDIVTALFGSRELVQSIGSPLDRAVSEGLQTLLITSDRPAAGRTSVATGIALSAATAGLRVALVDAAAASDRGHGSSLADTLNLDIQHGWLDAIRDGISIAETAIHSIEDQLTVIPQTATHAAKGATADEFVRMIAVLRRGFDLIVIDGPVCREPAFAAITGGRASLADPVSGGRNAGESTAIDAVILVQDARERDTDAAARMMDSLKAQGITGLGLVENFI